MPSSIPSITPTVQQIEAALNYFNGDTRVQPSYFVYDPYEYDCGITKDALIETVDSVCKLELEVEKLKQQLGGNIKL